MHVRIELNADEMFKKLLNYLVDIEAREGRYLCSI